MADLPPSEEKKQTFRQIDAEIKPYKLQELDDLLTNYNTKTPLVQRPINTEWVTKLSRDYLTDHIKNGLIAQPDVIHLCVFEGKCFLLDGQHRIKAYNYLCKLYKDVKQREAYFRALLNDDTVHTIDIEGFMATLHVTQVDVKVHFPSDAAHVRFLFDRINTRLKVELNLTPQQDTIRGAINMMRNKFPKAECTTITRPRQKVDWKRVEEQLRESKLVALYGTTTPEKLFRLLDAVNTYFYNLKPGTTNFFGPFPHSNRTTKYADHWAKCVKAKFMLGVYPNYEWIAELDSTAKYRIAANFASYAKLKEFFLKAV